jgi:OHCU decarboxylase
MIPLAALNALPLDAFVTALGAIFEHSPWVAERAAAARPFSSRLQLLDAMRAAVEAATADEQLALIRAHPQLGARGRARASLTDSSAGEQRRAGLDGCTDEEFARLQELNAAYVDKFACPFILAVRGHDPESIIANCERRLGNDWPLEQRTALREIGVIAGYRLADLVAAPTGNVSAPPAGGGAAGGIQAVAADSLDEFLLQNRQSLNHHRPWADHG